MPKLVIVSNRLPINVSKRKGKLVFKPSAGGLATGVSTIHQTMNTKWVGWPGIVLKSSHEKDMVTEELVKQSLYPVFLTERKVERFYEGFSNRTIWPLFHYFVQHVVYDESLWRAYVNVNEMFAEKVCENYQPGDYIWVHDYQLLLLPNILRNRLPDAAIGFFLHIPFPSFEIFRLLPWRNQILEGLLGADLVGFHTFDYARHFMSSAMRLKGLEHEVGTIQYDNRVIRIDSFPMGIDYKKFANAFKLEGVQKYIKMFALPRKNRKLILSIDRLDYTKGLLQRLQAFHDFLHQHPEFREKVEFILLVVPSRAKVQSYRELKKELDEMVGRINGSHGNMQWTPIRYLYRSLPFDAFAALYNLADICLITPFRDGMNLVAKEYIASRTDCTGVLILSEMAGAVGELDEAIIVNPNDMQDIVSAIARAMDMDETEQKVRMRNMQTVIARYDVRRWAHDFIDRLKELIKLQVENKVKILNTNNVKHIADQLVKSSQAALILDYDGTLVPFVNRPEMAKPSTQLIEMLRKINNVENIHVAIVSGRDKFSLEEFFKDIDIQIIAEHGAWFGEIAGNVRKWSTIEPLSQEWKEEIRHILEHYVDRTPGSFIEEKEFSLVWHYRRSDIGLGRLRALELMDTLNYMTANLNLQVLEGSKVVEVKNSGINKGRAALQIVSALEPDFILAAGDDWTDEDMFKALPSEAFTIKVGISVTSARYNVKNQKNMIQVLEELSERIFNETINRL